MSSEKKNLKHLLVLCYEFPFQSKLASCVRFIRLKVFVQNQRFTNEILLNGDLVKNNLFLNVKL